MEQGPTEKKIIDICMRGRLPLPKTIQNAPRLWLGLELFYGAFLDLDNCRQIGWGVGPIPWTAVSQYARDNGIRGELRDDLFAHVRAMDQAYLKFYEQKSKSK